MKKEEFTLQQKKSIYVTRKDTYLATDQVRPYGERLNITSESKRKTIARKLLKGYNAESN